MKRIEIAVTVLVLPFILALSAGEVGAQEKDKEKKVESLQEPGEGGLAEELMGQPDGVLRVKREDDGRLESLVVKATVEIEDVLGLTKGKRIARREAEMRCRAVLIQWMEAHCEFRETKDETILIVTEGENVTDAAGNDIHVETEKGENTTELTESFSSVAESVVRGLVALHSEVSGENAPTLVLIMGLRRSTMNSASRLAEELSESSEETRKPREGRDSPRERLPRESKTNPIIEEF